MSQNSSYLDQPLRTLEQVMEQRERSAERSAMRDDIARDDRRKAWLQDDACATLRDAQSEAHDASDKVYHAFCQAEDGDTNLGPDELRAIAGELRAVATKVESVALEMEERGI